MTIEQDQTKSRSRTTGKESETSLRERVGETYGSARERAVDAYDSARERASQASAKAGDQIDEAPLIALAGGLAVGALLAALLPRTRREDELLGGVGGKITGSARAAVDAAKDAGREKLNELNLTRDAGTSALQTIIKGVSEAATDAVRRKD
jgi:ElaB/YqjD/DUF883 family membrane-anchored ribosome-binding protein